MMLPALFFSLLVIGASASTNTSITAAPLDHWRVFFSSAYGCAQWDYIVSFDHNSPCHSQPISWNCFPQINANSFRAVQFNGYANLYFYFDTQCQQQATYWGLDDNFCYGQCMLSVGGVGYISWTNCQGCGGGGEQTETKPKISQIWKPNTNSPHASEPMAVHRRYACWNETTVLYNKGTCYVMPSPVGGRCGTYDCQNCGPYPLCSCYDEKHAPQPSLENGLTCDHLTDSDLNKRLRKAQHAFTF